MKRSLPVVVALATALACLGGAPALAAGTVPTGTASSGATAASAAARAATAPSVPRSVAVVASGATGAVISWKAPATSGTGPLLGYSLDGFVGSAKQPISTEWTSATTFRYDDLTPGVTYRLQLKAWNHDVASKAVTVSYTVPTTPTTPASPTVFAVVGGQIVSVPSTGGAATVVAAAPASGGWDVDATGVTVLDSAAGTLVRHDLANKATTLATGLVGAAELTVDASGTAFVNTADGGIAKITATGARSVLAAPFGAKGKQLSVGSDGRLVVLYAASGASFYTTARSYPAGSSTPTADTPYARSYGFYDMVAGPTGIYYTHDNAGGGTGFVSWRLQTGAGAPSTPSPSLSTRITTNTGGYGNDGVFHSLQAAKICFGYSPVNPCVADDTLTELVASPAAGTTTVVPASGLRVSPTGSSVDADTAGTVYVADAATSPGLWSVAGSGGAAKLLLAGAARDVKVRG